MNKHSKQRIAILVDADNIEIATKELFDSFIDYKKLINRVNDREMVRALYFKPEKQWQNSLKYVLEGAGYEIKLTPKNSDCWLTVDSISLISKIDVLVLISGDADYTPLLWFVRSHGVKAEVWMWNECTAERLKEAADDFVPLTKSFLFNAN